MGQTPAVSIVIPVYNEQENVALLHRAVHSACDRIGLPYEIVFIDDGSRDKTFKVLSGIQKQDPRLRVIRFRRNYGQTAAMAAGFDHAR